MSSREVLENVPSPKNSNSFVFDSQFLIQAAYFGFRIGELPVPCRYMDEASSINFRQSIIYGIEWYRYDQDSISVYFAEVSFNEI
jgi:hypothetical protein